MADKSLLLRTFNNHFVEFLKDILLVFPDNTDIKSGLNSFEMFSKFNPSLVIKAWYTKVFIPYSEVIDRGDISFFLEKDYSEDLSVVSNANEIINIIDKMRGPIKEMNDASKQHTTQYIQNLSRLSHLYSS